MRNRRNLALWAAAALLAGSGAIVSSGAWSAQGSAPSAGRYDHRAWPVSSTRSPATVATAAKAATARDHTKVLTALEIEDRSVAIDVGDPGESAGDYFVAEGTLKSADGTKTIGRDSVHCTLSVRAFVCDATASIFGKGKITVYGAFFRENDSRIAVTGGTGAYKEAGGQLTIAPSGNNTLLVFELTD